MSKNEVVKYDPNWKLKFKSEAEKIKKAFSDNCIEIHHIGSTAVEGLSAKPVIDIIVVVRQISSVSSIEGYRFYGELGIPFRRYFSSGNAHIHVFEENNPEIEQNLLFRDYLRDNFEAKNNYEKLKLELAHRYPDDRTKYSLEKNSLISEIIKRTGFNGLCLRYVFHDLEKIYYEKHLGDQGFYKFVLYKGSELVGVASVTNNLIIDKIAGTNYLDHMKKLLEKWISAENDSVKTQR